MAKTTAIDVFFSIGGVDLSDHVESLDLPISADIEDASSMSDTFHVKLAGLKDFSLSLSLRQDYALSSVDDTLFAMLGTSQTVIARPTSAAVSTTNPNYTGSAIVQDYQPIGNSVGEVAAATLTLAGSGAITRATS